MARNRPIRIFTMLAVLLVALIFASPKSKAAIYAGPGAGWLVISSHSYQQDAINVARKYARNFPSIVVFSSNNGFFAVSVGWINKQQGAALTRQLKSGGFLPADSYISNGQRWLQPVWTANNSHYENRRNFLNASRLYAPGNYSPQPKPKPTPIPYYVSELPSKNAKVTGLQRSGDSYLSLREGPHVTYDEIVRMRANTKLKITGKSKSWYRVKLRNGMIGFAHSKYVSVVEVPIIGPDRTVKEEVPTIGPDPNKGKVSDTAHIDQPKPEKIHQADSRDKDDNASTVDQKRVALVLGNSNYENTAALANPKNDADAIGTTLENLGFSVIKGLDLSKSGMELSIRDFVRQLPGADVALFFYAGHAMQVNGTNYLIPIDAQLEDSTAIDFETINFNVILEFMSETDRTSIALLDACRNNPLARNFTRKLGKSRSAFVGRGLAAPTSGEGQLLIGFATSPGEVALDGEGKNSPFTTALLEHMTTPGLEIELMLKRVKSDVFENTDGRQSPWNNSALRKEFYFAK